VTFKVLVVAQTKIHRQLKRNTKNYYEFANSLEIKTKKSRWNFLSINLTKRKNMSIPNQIKVKIILKWHQIKLFRQMKVNCFTNQKSGDLRKRWWLGNKFTKRWNKKEIFYEPNNNNDLKVLQRKVKLEVR